MKTRYKNDDGSLREVYHKVIKKWFPNMSNANVKLIFDMKKKISKKRLVFGRCMLAKDMEKFLTKREMEEGYDYFLIFDKKFWDLADEDEKIRLMRHECRHMFVNEHGKFAILPHDIEDFAVEIELNKDKPNWANRLSAIVEAAYEQEKESKR